MYLFLQPARYLFAAWMASALSLGWAQTITPIRISVQPAVYSMLPVHVATLNGYWKEVGLSPSIVTYPAGLPQIKGNADWDIGVTGAVPALIGARDFSLITIAVADNQSRTNVLMARKELVAEIRKQRIIPKGSRMAVTLNSTADYAAQTCLALWGGNIKEEMVYTGGSQAEVMEAGISGRADILGLWAPNIYTMQEKHGYEVLCSAADFGSGIYNSVVTTRQFAKDKPELIAAYLAATMRAVNWIKANPEKAQAFFIENSKKEGFTISPNGAKNDYELRPHFNMDEQLAVMGGSIEKINDSTVGRSIYGINVFLNEGKAGTRSVRPATFVDIGFMNKLKIDPKLSKFATQR